MGVAGNHSRVGIDGDSLGERGAVGHRGGEAERISACVGRKVASCVDADIGSFRDGKIGYVADGSIGSANSGADGRRRFGCLFLGVFFRNGSGCLDGGRLRRLGSLIGRDDCLRRARRVGSARSCFDGVCGRRRSFGAVGSEIDGRGGACDLDVSCVFDDVDLNRSA